MIIEVLFNVVKGVVTFVLNLLPDWEPVDFGGMADDLAAAFPAEIGTFLRWINYYVPLREALLLVVTAAGIWIAMLAFRVVLDVLTKLHILGGSS